MPTVAPITGISITFNAIAIFLLAYRCYYDHVRLRTATSSSSLTTATTNTAAPQFRKLSTTLLWILLVNQILVMARNPLMSICVLDKQCDQDVWGHGYGKWGPGGMVLFGLWVVADSLFYVACLLYLFVLLQRLEIFQQVLHYPKRTIPILRVVYTCMCLVSLSCVGMTAGKYFDASFEQKAALLRIGAGVFFVVMALSDITISAIMVRTFEKLVVDLDAAIQTHVNSETKPLKIIDAEPKPLKRSHMSLTKSQPLSTGEMISQLRWMMTALVILNLLAVVFWVAGGTIVPNRAIEVSQICEAWFAFHCVLAVKFLSKFKDSVMSQRRRGQVVEGQSELRDKAVSA
ncbi:hypothetical protein HK104_006075 [Borealophlyctis nickersoniae]|nr:hypothetical protein HK104_006075 [Borealophlyctis nickersoniae]